MSMTSTDSPGISVLLPPRVFLVCLLAGVLSDVLLPADIAGLASISWAIRLAVGVAIAGGGFAFMANGHGLFTELGTSVRTCRPATELATGGAYRFSRNPMYVGFVAILLGIGVAIGGLLTMLSAVVMFLFLDRYVIPREERYLLRRFGGAYEAYKRRVRRWL